MNQIIKIKVIPYSSQSEVIGWQDDVLKIKLTSPPVEGKANQELIKLLAKHFKTTKSNIKIIKGKTSKQKLIKIE